VIVVDMSRTYQNRPIARSLTAFFTALGGSLAATMARSLRVSNRKLKAAGRWSPAFRTIRDGWPAALAPFTQTNVAIRTASSQR
jgi:hypothetical protein